MTTINSAITNIAQKNELNKEKQDSGQLEKAVVERVITDQTGVGDLISTYPEIFKNFSPDRIPRNACVVRRITGGVDATAQSTVFAYPFFSSHLCMPVKTGETVWVLYDREIKTVGYWMSRVHGDEHSEDLSFSHHDRIYKPQEGDDDSPKTAEKAKGNKKEKAPVDDFTNLSLRQKNGKNEYEKIVGSVNDPVIYEPVPRFTKRPGDLVIHGSNNSMILLGTERYWTQLDTPENEQSNASEKPAPFTGVIDIVAGRGRGIISGSASRTAPTTFKNSRGYEEVVKDPRKGDKNINSEGDPDFYSDAARIYASMNSLVDEAFSLKDYIPILPTETEQRPLSIGSMCGMKADHIRLIARKDDELTINGSIRIIKEGLLSGDGADGCSLNLLEDGTMHMAAQKIFLGFASENGGDTDAQGDEIKGERQPYIKYQELKELLEKILDDIDKFCNTLNTHITPRSGMPSPQILRAAGELKMAISSRKIEIPKIKSKRIFGE